MKTTIYLFSLLIMLHSQVFSQAGNLDSSFNTNGIVVTNLSNVLDEGETVLLSSDGKIIIAGTTGYFGTQDIFLIRLNNDGSTDNTFGNNGKVVVDLGSQEFCTGAVMDNSGAIFVTGQMLNGQNDIALLKFLSNGVLDTSFGNLGTVVTDLGHDESVWKISIQSTNKIIVVGTQLTIPTKLFLIRYTVNGKIDSTFGINGVVAHSFGGVSGSWGSSLIINSLDEIFAFGSKDLIAIVAKFDPDGNIESGFGENGVALVDTNNLITVVNNGMALQSDGKIVMTAISDPIGYNVLVTRLNADGILDLSFGIDGKVITNIRDWDYPRDIKIQQDHKIIIIGYTQNNLQPTSILLIRYLENGTLDNTFGSNGIVTTDIGLNNSFANSIILQPDGKILITGSTWNGVDNDICTLRYNGSLPQGINNISFTEQVTFTPNPFTTSTTVSLPTSTVPFNLQLFDELGEESPLQYHTTQQGNSTMLTIDRGELQSGMYFLSITSKEKREVEKLIVR